MYCIPTKMLYVTHTSSSPRKTLFHVGLSSSSLYLLLLPQIRWWGCFYFPPELTTPPTLRFHWEGLTYFQFWTMWDSKSFLFQDFIEQTYYTALDSLTLFIYIYKWIHFYVHTHSTHTYLYIMYFVTQHCSPLLPTSSSPPTRSLSLSFFTYCKHHY